MSEEQYLLERIKKNNLIEAKSIVDSGLSIRFTDESGRSPFHLAESDEMLDYLREVDPTAFCVWEKEQDLIQACGRGQINEARRLVDSGVYVNCMNKFGFRPLHLAAVYDHKEVAVWLISSGASVNDKDQCGRTALHLALSDEMRDHLRDVDPAAYSEKEQELIQACEIGQLDQVERLIGFGVSVMCRDSGGRTPMHLAARWSHKEVALCLLNSGACVNVKDGEGKTPLHFVASRSKNNEEMARLLIDEGVDINVQNNLGDTALVIAARNNHLEISRLLIERGGGQDPQEMRRTLDYVRERGRATTFCMLMKQLKWLFRRGFVMFLASQSYLPPVPPPLADTMSRDELNDYYQRLYNPETRTNTAVHSVFFMEELQRYITSFLGPESHS